MPIWSAEIKELEVLYTSIKGKFPELEKELEQLVKFDDANVILIYSRRCLEVIISDLCINELKRPRKTELLKGIIDKLSHEEKVPSHIIASMEGLNSLSTFGAHPKDFDPEQVKPALNNLAIIIKWYLKYKRIEIFSKPLAVEEKEVITSTGKQAIDITKLEKSIAILPFKNDSPDEENTYFINGIMEEILNNLQKIKDLRIISRTSVEQYRNQTKTIPEIAKELGVNYIVEGSGQKYGNIFRLRTQLIIAAKERHLWGESYQQKITDVEDIFKIQSHIAGAIATELKAIITPHEKDLIQKIPTTKLEAYDAYLKGLFFYEQNEEVGTENAILWFKEAIIHDSTFALPWTYLSMCYWRLCSTADAPEFKEAKRAAKRALELDITLGIAIVNMAEILDNEYDFAGAEKKIKLALKMDPDNQYILRNAGRFYTKLGRRNESISFCNRALQNDPNNRAVLYYLTFAYFYAEFFKEAWATLNKHHELEYTGLSYLYYQLLLQESNFERIIKELSFEGDDNARNVALTAVNFSLGKKNEAEKLCDILKKGKIPAYWIALAYAFSDEPMKVCEWLEKSYTLKERELTYLGVEPAFKKFRNEPRVKKLLQEMKFPV